MKLFIAVFLSVFLAELGDKTQLATVLFAADNSRSQITIFAAAALALVLSTAIAVALGAAAGRYLAFLPLKMMAGLGFIGIGAFLLVESFSRTA